MQLLLNCHLATFKITNCTKKQPNNNLITVACVFALVLLYLWLATNSMSNNASTWPQHDINPCSYQSC